VIDTDSILSFHSHGFSRFVRPIDANTEYDVLLAGRLGADFMRDFAGQQPLEEKRRLACAYNYNALQSKVVKAIRLTRAIPACYGSTRNNLREFEWLDRLCADIGLRIIRNNFHEYARTKVELADVRLDDWLRVLLHDVAAFYQARESITPGLVHQQLLYTQTFLSYLAACAREQAVLPTLMVLANDHAPSHVAISMVMKGAGVPRLYLQHAEVTFAFPPLDFEYSVLRNDRSRQIYDLIGPAAGEVYIISRFESEFRADMLAKDRGESVSVVIYPTGRMVADGLRNVVRTLQSNKAVDKVYIKPHPNSYPPVHTILEDVQVEIVGEVPSHDHVALVGNSSVVVELLHQGVPVYQNFDFDPVVADYYGFVREGLTTDVATDDLAERFWRPYQLDERWRAVYANLNPAAQPGHDQTIAAFLKRMTGFASTIGATSSPVSRASAVRSGIRPRLRRFARIIATVSVNRFPNLAADGVRLCIRHSRLVSSHKLVRVADAAGNGDTERGATQDTAVQSAIVSEAGVGITATTVASFLRRLAIAPLVPLIKRSPDWAYFFVRFALGYTCLASQYKLESLGTRQTDALQLFARNVDVAKVELAVLTLDQIRGPASWMAASLRSDIFHDKELILAVDALTKQRSLAVPEIFASLAELPENSAIRLWCEIKRADWTRAFPSLPELQQYAQNVYAYDSDSYVRQQLEAVLLGLIVRAGDAADLQEFFDQATRLRPERLSVKLQLDVLRKFSMFPSYGAEAVRLRALFERTASPFHRLKFKNLDALTGTSNSTWRHAHAEEDFMRAAPSVLAKEFRDSVRPVYDRLRPRMRYIDLRIDSDQRAVLAGDIARSLEQGRPFSLVRLGDGEGYLFAEQGKYFSSEDATNRERHWWGTELPVDVRSRITNAARQAVAQADVIGIPVVHRFIRDLADSSPSIFATIQGRGLVQVLESIQDTASPDALFTEDRANVAMFQEHGYILDLARRAKKVVLVSSVQIEHLPDEFATIGNFVNIAIPTHSRTSGNSAYHKGDGPLPFIYQGLVERLEQHAGPQALVLVAGGLIGKIFIGAARARGAVALDIGGVVDDWVGSIMPTLR